MKSKWLKWVQNVYRQVLTMSNQNRNLFLKWHNCWQIHNLPKTKSHLSVGCQNQLRIQSKILKHLNWFHQILILGYLNIFLKLDRKMNKVAHSVIMLTNDFNSSSNQSLLPNRWTSSLTQNQTKIPFSAKTTTSSKTWASQCQTTKFNHSFLR